MNRAIAKIIQPQIKDLGGFQVRRLLPHDEQSMVGPFIFFDHMGPASFPPGQGVDVRPHPHINLATVTYLFEGSMLHRDSLGTVQEIKPGAVNWMIAGRGITHSERTPEAERTPESRLHGVQTWVALPEEVEDTDPSFHHHPASDIPTWEENGATLKLIAGEAYNRISPVQTFSPILYLDIQFPTGGKFTLTDDYSERAVYTVTEGITLNESPQLQHHLAILEPNYTVEISADTGGRCIVVGGERLGMRYKWWNFVSSRLERIEEAKQDWKAGNFASVPGETEFIPLPNQG
ncbi:pirin family protein [Spirulina sp. CS-785/01]|uniref:pirin family protein n=1 Tax=Spirulina sp. CS-785/01 TaxID=3021716 RepID=UPI0023311E94|nr:pirin family protein [Spirulina sp. CS-785/01]MDB9314159.1 pirin family protein [Spirulina sp. CS-785/01]